MSSLIRTLHAAKSSDVPSGMTDPHDQATFSAFVARPSTPSAATRYLVFNRLSCLLLWRREGSFFDCSVELVPTTVEHVISVVRSHLQVAGRVSVHPVRMAGALNQSSGERRRIAGWHEAVVRQQIVRPAHSGRDTRQSTSHRLDE